VVHFEAWAAVRSVRVKGVTNDDTLP